MAAGIWGKAAPFTPLPKNLDFQKFTAYTWNTEGKISRIFKKILSILIFPVGCYQLIHLLLGKTFFLPSAQYPSYKADKIRAEILAGRMRECLINQNLNVGEYPSTAFTRKYERITIEVDGERIDGMIVRASSSLKTDRWLLCSHGNGQTYEMQLLARDFHQLLDNLNCNALLFNYPGVIASTGSANRNKMTKAYRAMLNFLEDRRRGLAAKEIIGYGHSIGAAVQAEALAQHTLKSNIRYVFVKSRSFSNLSLAAEELAQLVMEQITYDLRNNRSFFLLKVLSYFPRRPSKLAGALVKIFGWNFSSVESSRRLQVPEIILQTASVKECARLNKSSLLVDFDGIITSGASLARPFIGAAAKGLRNPRQHIIGIEEDHSVFLKKTTVTWLALEIKRLLAVR